MQIDSRQHHQPHPAQLQPELNVFRPVGDVGHRLTGIDQSHTSQDQTKGLNDPITVIETCRVHEEGNCRNGNPRVHDLVQGFQDQGKVN